MICVMAHKDPAGVFIVEGFMEDKCNGFDIRSYRKNHAAIQHTHRAGILFTVCVRHPDRAALDEYLAKEPYVVEGVWEKIEVENMNVVLVNGERKK